MSKPTGESTKMVATTMSEFFQEIESIRNAISHVDENMSRVDNLYGKSLQQESSNYDKDQLEQLNVQIRQMQVQIRNAIKFLESQYLRMGAGNEKNSRQQQTENIKKKFVEQVKRFMQMEQSYQQKLKSRARRQMEIANPNITEEEIQHALDTDQGNQVFANAVLRSNRSGEAKNALREVQARHFEIKIIEKSITELAELMQDMAIITNEQAPVIEKIEQGAADVHTDIELANQNIDKAIVSAKAARKKKWFCLLVILLIIIVIIVVVVLVQVLK